MTSEVAGARPRVLIAFSRAICGEMLTERNVARLDSQFDWKFLDCGGDGDGSMRPNADPVTTAALQAEIGEVDALVCGHGAPMVDGTTSALAPRLRFVGDLIGDRFAARIDLEAMHAAGIKVIDTTNGISPQVAEWALALIMISLRNAGEHFRRMINDEVYVRPRYGWSFEHGELTGKKVGLIGCGHIGRRLVRLLAPFRCSIRVYDPYIPKDIPDELGFLLTSLDYVLSTSDAVVLLAPLTPATRRLLGKREFNLMPPGSVFVNVARGAIIDPDALLERLQRGDLVAALDVFDPEPIPAGSPFRQMPNVFLTPHLAGTTVESWPRVFSIMIDELERFFAGHETLYDLNTRTIASRRGERLAVR
jgi:phosphoglycerate dehydrogenase-like enzyme